MAGASGRLTPRAAHAQPRLSVATFNATFGTDP
jgi:hypothetical protein